jgi:hypothetical protein
MKRLLCLVVVGLLVNAICGAQPPADSRPARSNVLGAEYPRVTDDGRAIFRWTGTAAPLAQRLRAAFVQVGHRRPI